VNIDFVQPKFKPPTGAERFILSVGRALAATGCRVRIVCHQFDPLCRPLAEGLIVEESGLRLDWSGNHYLDSISSYVQCFRLRPLLAPDADVVCLFGPALPLAALRPPPSTRLVHFCYEPPRAVGVDNADVLARVGRWRWLLRPALRAYRAVDHWLVRRVAAILVSGPFAQQLVRAEYGLPSEVVTPGTSFVGMHPERSAARTSLGIGDADRMALSVNFLHPRKRVDLLLAAWARVEALLPAARLLIVGEGPERSALERLSARLGLERARFVGYVAEDELARFYAAADLLVHVARQETFGLTIVEAAAFAVPAVVADEGGPRYTVVQDETGLRVPAEEGALAEAMAKLLGDRAASGLMGERARARATAHYTWQRGAEEFLEVCRGLGVDPHPSPDLL
jgi:glycosyltransferase involved in cell wall biosynthesis